MSTNFSSNFPENCSSAAAEFLANPLLEGLLDTHDVPVLLCSKSLVVEKANNAACKLLAQPGVSIAGKPIESFLPGDIPARDFRQWLEPLAGEQSGLWERVFMAGGINYTVSVSIIGNQMLFAIRSASEQPKHVDVRNFEMLFENMSSAFVFLKAVPDAGGVLEHQILDVNSTFEIVFGVDKREAVGRNICDVLPGLDGEILRNLAKSARIGSSSISSYHFKGSSKHFDVRTYSPRKGYSAAVFNDIKHETETRNDLLIKSELSKAFAMGHDSSLYKVVLDLVLRNTNSKYGFIGCVEGDSVLCLAKKDPNMMVSINSQGCEVFKMTPSSPCGQAFDTRSQVVMRGYLGHSELLVTPVICDSNTVAGFIGSAETDNGFSLKARTFIKGLAEYISPLMVSEIKERDYRRQLVEAKERAEEGSRLKTAFLSNMSHEVRTPASIILNSMTLISKTGNFTPKQSMLFRFAQESLDDLLDILESLMDISKLQTQQCVVNNSPVNINKMMDQIYKTCCIKAENENLPLELYCPLPDSECNVISDPHKLSKIMRCLVSNGIKFTNDGGVAFGYSYDGDCYTFFVEDTGIGIKQEEQKNIFTSFFKVDNSRERKYNGAGVGLAISKGYTDLLGGKIWFESEPKKGTTFYVKFRFPKAEGRAR